MCINAKFRSAANLEHNSYVKFSIRFSISSEIAVSHENLGGLTIFVPSGGTVCLRRAGKFLLCKGGLSL